MAGSKYSAGKIVLEIEGSPVGFVHSAEGGEPFGVVGQGAPTGGQVDKGVVTVGYAPIVVEVGTSIGAPLLDWVAEMLSGAQAAPRAGAVVFLDYAMKERSRLEWPAAQISEVGFPAADASAKDAALLRVTLEPEQTTRAGGSGAGYQISMPAKAAKTSTNFRLSIDGIGAITKAMKVDSVMVRRNQADGGAGPTPDWRLDVSDVVFWLPTSDIAPLTAWFDEFVLGGASTDERNASLAFLDQNMNELLRVDFSGVGIYHISHERLESNAEVVARAKVEMYCEAVSLVTLPAPAAPPPPDPVPRSAVDALAAAVVSALGERSPVTELTADDIADRLVGSVTGSPVVDDRERGRGLGSKWAGAQARLDELEVVAALAGRDGWSALALGEGHTLVTFLVAGGELATDEIGPIELERDEFTIGLVEGAAEVYREVAPRIAERRGG